MLNAQLFQQGHIFLVFVVRVARYVAAAMVVHQLGVNVGVIIPDIFAFSVFIPRTCSRANGLMYGYIIVVQTYLLLGMQRWQCRTGSHLEMPCC